MLVWYEGVRSGQIYTDSLWFDTFSVEFKKNNILKVKVKKLCLKFLISKLGKRNFENNDYIHQMSKQHT